MRIKNYNELNSLELDTLREVGSIGTGNAATALSALIGEEVRIELPEVRIMEYNEAIEWIGGPEEITAGEDERSDRRHHALRAAARFCESYSP